MHDALGEKMRSIIAKYIEHKKLSMVNTKSEAHPHYSVHSRCISRLSWWAYWPHRGERPKRRRAVRRNGTEPRQRNSRECQFISIDDGGNQCWESLGHCRARHGVRWRWQDCFYRIRHHKTTSYLIIGYISDKECYSGSDMRDPRETTQVVGWLIRCISAGVSPMAYPCLFLMYVIFT